MLMLYLKGVVLLLQFDHLQSLLVHLRPEVLELGLEFLLFKRGLVFQCLNVLLFGSFGLMQSHLELFVSFVDFLNMLVFLSHPESQRGQIKLFVLLNFLN